MSNHIIKNRFGIYYYRVTTPLDVQKLIPCLKKDVRISLRTRSIRLARSLAANYHAEISNFFSDIRQMSDKKDKNSNFISKVKISRSEEDSSFDALATLSKGNADLKQFFLEFQSQQHRKVTLKSFKLDTVEVINRFFEIVELVVKDNHPIDQYLAELNLKPERKKSGENDGIDKSVAIQSIRRIAKSTADDVAMQHIKRFDQTQFGQAMAFISRENIQKKTATFIVTTPANDILIDGLKTDGMDNDDDALAFILQPHFSQMQLNIAASSSQSINANQSSFTPRRVQRFSEAAKAYFPQRTSGLKGRYGLTRVKAAIELFIEVLGDLSLEQITQAHVDDLLGVLNVLPPNRNKNPAYRTQSARQLAEKYKPGDELITAGGRVHYVNEWKGIFALAVERGYCERNFFETPGLVKIRREKSSGRASKSSRRFKDDEIIEIFSKSNFTDGSLRSWHFWIPLICLYSGARVGEIAQLNWADVRKEKGVWVFDINTIDSESSLKNESSKRCVPIHDELLKLGIVDLAEAMRLTYEQKVHTCSKLFWEMKKGADKWSHDVGRWFSDTFFKTLSFERPGDKFHAFRHTFVDLMKNAGVDESTYGAIIGHNVSLRTGGMYGDLHSIHTLRDAIHKIKPLPKSSVDRLTPYWLPKEFLSTDKGGKSAVIIDQTKTIRRDKYLLERFLTIAGPKSLLFANGDYKFSPK